jgi:hypothetical protein
MPATLTCPACGAPLEIQAGEKIVHCKFCGNEVSVPEAGIASALTGVLPGGLDLQGIMRLKEVKALAKDGKKDEAARLYREVTKASEEDARKAVEAIAAGQPVVLSSIGKPTVTQTTFSGSTEQVMDQIEDFFEGQTGPGMKEDEEALKKLLSGGTPGSDDPAASNP